MDQQIEQLQKRRPGSLIVISGPSGVGKGTIVKQLVAQSPELRLSISMTSRPPRPGEVHGHSYFFVSRSEFESLIQEQAFLEFATYNGNYYGTPKAFVNEQLKAGSDVILEIEVQGAEQVRQQTSEEALHVFVLPPNEAILRQRLENRSTETPEVIEQRLAEVTKEMAHLSHYDYFVINADLNHAVADVLAILRTRRLRILQEMPEHKSLKTLRGASHDEH